MNVKLPDECPWPSAEEMCRGAYTDGKGRCCLLGWAKVAAGLHPNNISALCNPVYCVFRSALQKETDCSQITLWNDSHTPTQCARVFRRAMVRLGYNGKVR